MLSCGFFFQIPLLIESSCTHGPVFLSIARILWRWESVGFFDFIGFRSYEKAIDVVSSVILVFF